MSLFGKKCCKDSACCNRKTSYLKVILEEEKDVLKEILTKAAKETLTEAVESKLRSEQWEGCFDVAKDLIKDDSTRPTLKAKKQEQQQHPEQQQDQQQEQLRRTDPTQPSRPEAAAGEQDIPLLSMKSGSSNQQ
ncbi:actin cytoskeleton-regulatory complex protein PAN1-like [Micropterus dolomieu]|nr:actin cytoskeleton-regulatory complex protein PAN1-like [Micropterus dolomieu]